MTLWVLDGNNLMGARADGWWRDRAGASARLAAELDRWQAGAAAPAIVVFDGRRPADWPVADREGFEVRFAGRSDPDAADDVIVALVEERYAEEPDLVVVTSDRGLRRRLPPGVQTRGAGRFLSH